MSATGEAGFTLLEMLVTLAICALIAGLGFPALQHATDHFAFERTAADTRSALRRARAMAISSEAPIILTLAADGRLMAGGQVLSPPLPKGVSVSFTPGPVQFYPDGSARAAQIRVGNAREFWAARIEPSGLVS